MEFSVTDQQIPMMMRIINQLQRMQQKKATADATNLVVESEPEPESSPEHQKQSMAGWAWSYVPRVLPAWEDDPKQEEEMLAITGHMSQFGIYIDDAMLTFKISEASLEKSNVYSQSKYKYWPLITFSLEGISVEAQINSKLYKQINIIISEILLQPLGDCSCSTMEVDDKLLNPYLKSGFRANNFKSSDVIEKHNPEKESKRLSTEDTIEADTNGIPAVCVYFRYELELPEDLSSDDLSQVEDLEYSNLMERKDLRVDVAPIKLLLCSGLIHRMLTVKSACMAYEFVNYDNKLENEAQSERQLSDLAPPKEEDVEGLLESIPVNTVSVSMRNITIEFQMMDHPAFTPTKDVLVKRRKKMSITQNPMVLQNPPKITIECESIEVRMTNPLYTKRLIETTCQLPDPPAHMFDACHMDVMVKIIGFCSKLIINDKHIMILTPTSASCHFKSILSPQFWVNPDTPHVTIEVESESISLTATSPKIAIIQHIAHSLLNLNCDTLNFMNSSLLEDASNEYGLVYMELCIEGLDFKKVDTNTTITIEAKFGSLKVFLFDPIISDNKNSEMQQVLIISGPEFKDDAKTINPPKDEPLFAATIQFPISPDKLVHPAIVHFNVRDTRLCLDPLLYKLLLYSPKFSPIANTESKPIASRKLSRTVSEVNTHETPRKLKAPHESIHSSLDQGTSAPAKSDFKIVEEDLMDLQEKIYVNLKKWFDVWKGVLLFGDVHQCAIYVPVKSLSAVGSQGIGHAVEVAMSQESPPDIFVFTLPTAKVRNSAHKDSLDVFFDTIPVKVPEAIWSLNKSSFPWSISVMDLSCFTWQNGEKLNWLAPVGLTGTIGLSTKSVDERRKPNKSSDMKSDDEKLMESGRLNASDLDVGSFGVCVHIDMTPMVISISEIQVCLLANLVEGIVNVVNSMSKDLPEELPPVPEIQEPLRNISTRSPTILKNSSLETGSSDKSSHLRTETMETDSEKLTAWVQCTFTKFSVELLANDAITKTSASPTNATLKFVIDAEDIVSSLDFQNVYLKLKGKIGSASVMHYVKENDKWVPGEFLGFVMRANEESPGSEREESSFANITITRASCKHTHDLWGTSKKHKIPQKKPQAPNKFITEIMVTLQLIDILVSPATLKNYFIVLEPLLHVSADYKLPATRMNRIESAKPLPVASHVAGNPLPLVYFDFHGFRFIMPSVELGKEQSMHNTFIFEIKGIHLAPAAVNPICRTPVKPEIYQQAAQARILDVPGSDVEDRQYQLDILGIAINSGTWQEISQLLKTMKKESLLRTMNENPALEWNNSGIHGISSAPEIKIWPMVAKFDISIVAAPAMRYKRDVICGNSVEINFKSDIKLAISMGQIKLLMALGDEATNTAYSLMSKKREMRKCARIEYIIKPIDTKDSGIETSDTTSVKAKVHHHLKKTKEKITNVIHEFDKPPAEDFVPSDILITGSEISFTLYDVERRTKKKKSKSSDPSEQDKGYEASEEGSSDEKTIYEKVFSPLFYFSLSQPNAFLADTEMGKKMQISCFDIAMKLCGVEKKMAKGIPTGDDFAVNLLETKSGHPNEETGILPAFLTIKARRDLGKTGVIDLDIARPTKILFSVPRVTCIINTYDKLLTLMKISEKASGVSEIESDESIASADVASKFKEITDALQGFTTININFSQINVAVQTSNLKELNVSIGKLINQFTVSSRPEKLMNKLELEAITVGITKGEETKILLNPLFIDANFTLFWESWQNLDSNPQIQVAIHTDYIMLHLSPDKLRYLDVVQKEVLEFISKLPKAVVAHMNMNENETTEKVALVEKEQHYKDDLRAGAFQFIDSTNDNIDELPLPYQVLFWNRNLSAMAWRYPQPRALTKIRIFPVPFKICSENIENTKIVCHLEYWSECHKRYLPCLQFNLSETEILHIDLTRNTTQQQIVSSSWRVVLSCAEDSDYTLCQVLVHPRAIAGCIRVDSYFNKSLIPDLTLSLHLQCITLLVMNHFNDKINFTMPSSLKEYKPDLKIPEHHGFLTLTLDNIKAYAATWNFETIVADLTTTIKCSVLNYNFLTEELLVEPFSSKIEINYAKSMAVNLVSKPIHIVLGATACHTLATSALMWEQCFAYEPEKPLEYIIVTHYVICNDTNLELRFGQVGMEEIKLPPRHCHMYSWRSQKSKQNIRVAFGSNRRAWSLPFRIDEDGMDICNIPNESLTLMVTIKSLSGTQRQVTFSGLLIIANMLVEHFEMKIVETEVTDRESEFNNAEVHIVKSKSMPPSLFVNRNKLYALRLRFYGLDSAWSGDVPLMENKKSAQPWLVKVPLQERGQFLSIWCKVVIQHFVGGSKILVVFWPLFMVRSHLPINAKVHIETPTLNVNLESTIRGLGEYQQLYCPGTIDHSHQLTFELKNCIPGSNPYVPLNYSLVDQKVFFKKDEHETIDDILSVITTFDKSHFPYFSEELGNIEFTAEEDQTLTHVQAKYHNACQYSSALLLELLPVSLLLNTLGCQISIIINGKELCRVRHYGIVSPPKLEEAFYIGVGLGSTWNLTQPLQLSNSSWAQTFYMPQISGKIPLEGTIKTVVKCDTYACVVAVSSTIQNEIRLLKVTSSHVLTNHLNFKVHVICYAVPEKEFNFEIPKKIEHGFSLESKLFESRSAYPIRKWLVLGNQSEQKPYALYISFSKNKTNWTCPVRVDKLFTRSGLSFQADDKNMPIVLVALEYKGQLQMSLHHDMQPQLSISNQTGKKLFCAQACGTQMSVVKDCEHFDWLCALETGQATYYTMPLVSQKFPELLGSNNYYLVLAADSDQSTGLHWSIPINVGSFNDQFIRIPFYGDAKVSIHYSVHTINIEILSVSQVQVSASDIRVRLTMAEKENYKQDYLHQQATTSTADTSAYYSAEESSLALLPRHEREMVHMIPTTSTQSPSSVDSRSDEFAIADIYNLRLLIFLKGIILTLTSDVENGGAEKTELITVTLDDIAANISKKEVTEMVLTIYDLQVDNQLFEKYPYDFPVLVFAQAKRTKKDYKIFNIPVNQLIVSAQESALIKMEISLESWRDNVLDIEATKLRDILIRLEPLSVYLEDVYLFKLMDHLQVLNPQRLIIFPAIQEPALRKLTNDCVNLPSIVNYASSLPANPLAFRSLVIHPISAQVSLHSSIKAFIALDQTPFSFGKFEKRNVFTTADKLGHVLMMHYVTGALTGAGWAISSLELLGNPGGLARAVGTGLSDLIYLPMQGLAHGPMAFLRGASNGLSSLISHTTSGTLSSITKMASSVARNLDRLTYDEEHMRRTQDARRAKPQGVAQGVTQGLAGLGINLLGAVGGIAHHPLQSVINAGASPTGIIGGVTKGIVGAVTKPLSGAAELLALTGQGLLQGAGWSNLPEARMQPSPFEILNTPNAILKYKWKFGATIPQSNILLVVDAVSYNEQNEFDAVSLILTTDSLVIVDVDEDMPQRILPLKELTGCTTNDPTLLCLTLQVPSVAQKDIFTDMDPTARARVADYIRNTTGAMYSDNLSPEHLRMDVSPDESETESSVHDGDGGSETITLEYYVNPQIKNYFLCLMGLAKQQSLKYSFPVL